MLLIRIIANLQAPVLRGVRVKVVLPPSLQGQGGELQVRASQSQWGALESLTEAFLPGKQPASSLSQAPGTTQPSH